MGERVFQNDDGEKLDIQNSKHLFKQNSQFKSREGVPSEQSGGLAPSGPPFPQQILPKCFPKFCHSLKYHLSVLRKESILHYLWNKCANFREKNNSTLINAYRIMHYIPRNVSVRPHQVSHCAGPLMPCYETTCIDFLYDAHLHPTFLFDRFKCLMLFTNLHFSSIIQRSWMVETECISCLWVVSVFASHQYCFCVVKICGHCVHTKHKKGKKCCESVLRLSRLDTY